MPLRIVRLFLARPSYLLVLFPGKAGRERRARLLATTGGAVPQTSMLAYHHALVQLLAQLASGFHNEVEMLIQSVMPLDELCEHILDSFCPHQARASFFVRRFSPMTISPGYHPLQVRASFLALLKEAYTITQLKVAALARSPAIWQVPTHAAHSKYRRSKYSHSKYSHLACAHAARNVTIM